MNGTHQCDCVNYCGGFGPQYVSPTCNHLLRRSRTASVRARPREAWLTCLVAGSRSWCVASCRFVSFPFMSLWLYSVLFCSVLFCSVLVCSVLFCSVPSLPCSAWCRFVVRCFVRLLFPGTVLVFVLFVVFLLVCVVWVCCALRCYDLSGWRRS